LEEENDEKLYQTGGINLDTLEAVLKY